MKNILYIANVRMPTEKAHGYQIVKMCEAFAECGAKVELVVPFRKNEIQSDPFMYWNIKRSFTITVIGVRDFMQHKFISRHVAFLVNSFLFAISVARYIVVHNNFDIVYTRDREVALLALFFKRKFVWEIHFLPRAMFLYNFIFKRIFLLVTITEHLKKFLVAQGIAGEKTIVSPDAADLSKFIFSISKEQLRRELELPQDKHIILYAGQFLPWKGVHTLLEGAEYLSNKFLTVLLGGSKSDIARFTPKKRNNVIFIRRVNSDLVPKWLMAADILVLPNSAKYKISKYYTSPLKLFEYMASGTPIVSSDLPSIREIVSEKDVIFFKPDDSRDLARAIKQISQDTELRRHLSESAREKAKQYTWQRRAEYIYDILQNI